MGRPTMPEPENPHHYPKSAWFMRGECVDLAKDILDDDSIQLVLCDPPFGIQETEVESAYGRDSSKVIRSYAEAPEDYLKFTLDWMAQAKRVLRPNGSLYVVIGHTSLIHVLNAAEKLKLITVNHIIWTHNFPLGTKKHFSTCHYHILLYAKTETPFFNTYCRFGPQETYLNEKGKPKKALYKDLQDVWFINKQYSPGMKKNLNKLPDALIEKILLYSSNEGDYVADFFAGNFTTAYNALRLGRRVITMELNAEAWKEHIVGDRDSDDETTLNFVYRGHGLKDLKQVEVIKPRRQGTKFAKDEKRRIYEDYLKFRQQRIPQGRIYEMLCEHYERGECSIQKVVKEFKQHTTSGEA
jgi:site-specific DNA-methyltransferase (adenine-specific)